MHTYDSIESIETFFNSQKEELSKFIKQIQHPYAKLVIQLKSQLGPELFGIIEGQLNFSIPKIDVLLGREPSFGNDHLFMIFIPGVKDIFLIKECLTELEEEDLAILSDAFASLGIRVEEQPAPHNTFSYILKRA